MFPKPKPSICLSHCAARQPQRYRTCATDNTSREALHKPAAQIPRLPLSTPTPTPVPIPSQDRVFKNLPTSDLLRTLSVLSVAALPSPILSFLIHFIRRHSSFISNSRILSWPVRQTFYKAFCIGEANFDIASNINTMKTRGITGVVLSFAREAKLGHNESNVDLVGNDPQLRSWVKSNVDTVARVGKGDYIAVKITGAGPAAVHAMEAFDAKRRCNKTISNEMKVLRNALFEICTAGKNKDVKIMVDAESSYHQPAIDWVTLEAMAAFNTSDSALVFNTYQMYLKSGFDTLKSHLRIAQARNYVSGIKLVRGAYIYVEPERASIIHENKVDCDNAYDAAVELLLRGKQFEGIEYPNSWKAEVMLATHNMNSVDKALHMYSQQDVSHNAIAGTQKLVFAQLMGMADEITMKLASRLQAMGEKSGLGVYKYTVWGSLEDCLLYMLRRAEENQDAAARSRVTAVLMLKEIGTRLRFWRS